MIIKHISLDPSYVRRVLCLKVASEREAQTICQDACEELELDKLMTVISVDYQYDLRKLSVQYRKVLNGDISVCRLIRKLFAVFGMRIWLDNVDVVVGNNLVLPLRLETNRLQYFKLCGIDESAIVLGDAESEMGWKSEEILRHEIRDIDPDPPPIEPIDKGTRRAQRRRLKKIEMRSRPDGGPMCRGSHFAYLGPSSQHPPHSSPLSNFRVSSAPPSPCLSASTLYGRYEKNQHESYSEYAMHREEEFPRYRMTSRPHARVVSTNTYSTPPSSYSDSRLPLDPYSEHVRDVSVSLVHYDSSSSSPWQADTPYSPFPDASQASSSYEQGMSPYRSWTSGRHHIRRPL
jgi:hypothetical protein